MNDRILAVALVAVGCAAATACAADEDATSLTPITVSAQRASGSTVPAPPGLRTISFGGEQLTFWPFISQDLATTENDRDPVNLIFRGHADPRSLRAALLTLNGDRTAYGMPNVFPLNCTWSDADGFMQGTYAANVGWTGSVIQLQCGPFSPLRFHLRLFPAGNWTLANAHMDLRIPGSADHQVISWELAEQLVLVDFLRTGLLGAAPDVVPALNPAPYRTIPAIIYNGMPEDLKALIGGPAGTVSADVPVGTDGNATVLTLAGSVTPVADTHTETLDFMYDTPAPRPFCASGPTDWVYLQGPITLTTTVTQSAGGTIKQQMRAHGTLRVTALNPITGELGATTMSEINENHESIFGDGVLEINSMLWKKQTAAGGFGASQLIKLQIGSRAQYSNDEKCN